MELAGYDSSKVVYLFDFFRPEGQIFVPELTARIAQRYSFVKFPSPENLLKNERTFGVGKFRDSQINELSVFSDGIIATASCDTDVIDDFIDDAIAWVTEEYGLIEIPNAPPERTYESTITVIANADLLRAVAPRNDLAAIVNGIYKPDKYIAAPMYLNGIGLQIDRDQFPGRRKPVGFTLERKLGQPVSRNAFYTTAPLKTKDHLEVLRTLERLAV